MPKPLERLGRIRIAGLPKVVNKDQGDGTTIVEIVTPDTPEPCVKVKYFTWDGGKQKYEEHVEVFPIDQSGRADHPKCPSGYSEDGTKLSCVSPSCSFYSDLCKYASFRWH